jgi:hypothetical protein
VRPPTPFSFFGFPTDLPECGSIPLRQEDAWRPSFREPGVGCARCAWEVEATSLLGAH